MVCVACGGMYNAMSCCVPSVWKATADKTVDTMEALGTLLLVRSFIPILASLWECVRGGLLSSRWVQACLAYLSLVRIEHHL